MLKEIKPVPLLKWYLIYKMKFTNLYPVNIISGSKRHLSMLLIDYLLINY